MITAWKDPEGFEMPDITSARMFNEGLPTSSRGGSYAGSIGHVDVGFIARLPEPAQRIVRSLADEADELNMLSHAMNERREAIRDAKARAEGRIRELKDPMNTYAKLSGPEIENQRKIIAECADDLARLEVRNAENNTKARVSGQLIESARTLVRAADRDKPITLHIGPQPQLRKNETALEAIEARRRRLRELSADFDRTKVAPRPAAEIKAQERQRILGLAKMGEPNAFMAIEQGLPIQWATKSVPIEGGSGGFVTVDDVVTTLCMAIPDVMIARAEAAIDAVSDDENALSDADREKALMEIRRDQLATEREEFAFVNLANSQSGRVLFRGDTDPRAFLGLSDDMPAARRE
jgi:hypothetical protein